MKKFIFTDSYNLDVLSFLNLMSADEYYVKLYPDDFNRFYPMLSDGIKSGYSAFLKSIGRSNIAVALTAAVSLVENFNDREVKELLVAQDEIEVNLYDAGFPDVLVGGIKMLPQFAGLIVGLIKELEDNGFKEFWEENRRPLMRKRTEELGGLLEWNELLYLVEEYKRIPSDEVNVYVCSYAHPHGTKIYKDSLILDRIWPDKAMVNTITHELFHPPYELKPVRDSVKSLSEMDFVKKAYDNQNPQTAYNPEEVFIEENIVEALGTYIAYKYGFEDDPYGYFRKHDGGSHVVSPYMFKYLTMNEIGEGQSFESYFMDFVLEIDSMEIHTEMS